MCAGSQLDHCAWHSLSRLCLWRIAGRFGSAGSSYPEALPVVSEERLQVKEGAMTEKSKG